MRQIAQSIWWWMRVAVLVCVAGYVMASLWCNSGADRNVSVWYWPGRTETTSVVALALASFLAGAVAGTTAFALFRASVKYRRTREIRRRRAIEEHREAVARKAARLRVKPTPEPTVRVKEPPRVERPEAIIVPLTPPAPVRPRPAVTTPAIIAPALVTPPPAEPTLPVVVSRPSDDAGPDDEPTRAEATHVEATHVEATRATPFAMSPIAPRPGEPLPPEPLPLVEEARDASGPLSPVRRGEG